MGWCERIKYLMFNYHLRAARHCCDGTGWKIEEERPHCWAVLRSVDGKHKMNVIIVKPGHVYLLLVSNVFLGEKEVPATVAEYLLRRNDGILPQWSMNEDGGCISFHIQFSALELNPRASELRDISRTMLEEECAFEKMFAGK